jgi:pimeloyl-ACP methyl ester carboxylesterase
MAITRRHALQGAATGAGLATFAVAGAAPSTAQVKGRTFVLVHGSWHGGWCWAHVRDILAANGHRVLTPTLTGLADRSHLLTKDVTLDTHIADIVNLFRWEDLENVVLVGHSYAGWVITGAIEKVLPQVASIVYLDAFIPDNGDTGLTLSSAVFRKSLEDAIAKGEVGRPVPPAGTFKIIEAGNAAWVQAKMTPQPLAVSMQPIVVTGAYNKVAKKTYIRAPAFAQPGFDAYLARCKADPGWRTYVFPPEEAGHDVMVDAPQRLAEILADVA